MNRKVHMVTYIPYTGYYPACMPGYNGMFTSTDVKRRVTCKRCIKHWLRKRREWQ